MTNSQKHAYRDLTDLLVIKFGGKSLSSAMRVRSLAQKTIEFHQSRPTLVVVSAMGDDTNKLINLADEVSGGSCISEDLVNVVSYGENLSASVFATAIRSLGVNAEAITPWSDKWPIFIKGGQRVELSREKINQNVDIEIIENLTIAHIEEGIKELLKNSIIPVISGFLALSEKREIITLGRGGSDTSAFLLGKYLSASEVIIVTDVQGVMKADPNRVNDAERVNYISVDEIDSVARSGGQVLHPQSLAFKTDSMKARIVHFEETDFDQGGTEIVGFFKAKLKGIRKKLALITIVGEDLSIHQSFWQDLGTLLGKISIQILGLSFTESFVGFYVTDDDSDSLYEHLSGFINGKPYIKNMVQRHGIARLNLSSHDNAENPEIISEICDKLIERDIKVIEIITNQSDISVFIDWEHRKEAGKLFKRFATDINLREVLKKEE